MRSSSAPSARGTKFVSGRRIRRARERRFCARNASDRRGAPFGEIFLCRSRARLAVPECIQPYQGVSHVGWGLKVHPDRGFQGARFILFYCQCERSKEYSNRVRRGDWAACHDVIGTAYRVGSVRVAYGQHGRRDAVGLGRVVHRIRGHGGTVAGDPKITRGRCGRTGEPRAGRGWRDRRSGRSWLKNRNHRRWDCSRRPRTRTSRRARRLATPPGPGLRGRSRGGRAARAAR